jgi:hypothetical protein
MVRFPADARDFSVLQSAQINTGTHPTFSSIGTRGSYPRVKRPGSQLTIHFHITLRSKIQGTVSVIPHLAWFLTKHRHLTFTFSLHTFLNQIRSTSHFSYRDVTHVYIFVASVIRKSCSLTKATNQIQN